MTTMPTKTASDADVYVTTLVFGSFLLTSTGWLLWMGQLATLPSTVSVEFITLVCSYLVQALGIGIYMEYARKRPALTSPRACACGVILYILSLIPSVLSQNFAIVLVAGAVMNILCGALQGFYLSHIASLVDTSHRGTVFGVGCALATLAGWAFDKFAGGTLLHGASGLIVCGVLGALIIPLVLSPPAKGRIFQPQESQHAPGTMMALACLLVTLASLTNNLGYGFPHADLLEGVDLASSRLFYGLGLVIAGLVSDKNRTYGMLCCACSLIVPLLSLALAGAKVPATVLWAVGYLLTGFFSVFRVTLLADLAADHEQPALAGAGLMFGRVGDATGTAICLALSPSPVLLIVLVCAFFAATLLLFYMFLRHIEAPAVQAAPANVPSEQELFDTFAAKCGLSERQTEVLRLMLDGRSNAQIASDLVVSDNTVKFHVRNVLKKADCKNRQELQASWTQHKESHAS